MNEDLFSASQRSNEAVALIVVPGRDLPLGAHSQFLEFRSLSSLTYFARKGIFCLRQLDRKSDALTAREFCVNELCIVMHSEVPTATGAPATG